MKQVDYINYYDAVEKKRTVPDIKDLRFQYFGAAEGLLDYILTYGCITKYDYCAYLFEDIPADKEFQWRREILYTDSDVSRIIKNGDYFVIV